MLTRFMYFPGHKVAILKACDMRKIYRYNTLKHSLTWKTLVIFSLGQNYGGIYLRKRITASCCCVIPLNGKIKFVSPSNEMLITSTFC